MREAQRGSAEALEELFRRHWRRAHRAAYLVVGDSAAAEDIAQESFLAAIRALDRFDRRRPFGPWLHRITVNRAIDFARARALRAESALPARRARGGGDPGDAISDELLAALAELGPEHRAVVVLRYVLEYTPGEIGEILGLPRGTVNSRLRRGARPAAAGDRGGTADEARDRELGRRLRELRAPGRGRGRGALVGGRPRRLRGAHAGAPGRRARAGSLWRSPAAPPLLAIGLSPAGAKVGDLVSDVVGIGEPDAKPALRSLPAAGELLVESPSRALGRPRRRLEAAARRLRRRDLVAERRLRRRRGRPRAGRARAGRRRPLDYHGAGRGSATRAGRGPRSTPGSPTAAAATCGWSPATGAATAIT